MTTALDIKLTKVAKTLLLKFGMTVDYTNNTPGVYDPATRTTSGGGIATTSVRLAPPAPVNDRMVDGEIYKIGDQITYIADLDLGFVPEAPHDYVVIGGETFTVIAARKIFSGDAVAVYELGLRKGVGDGRTS